MKKALWIIILVLVSVGVVYCAPTDAESSHVEEVIENKDEHVFSITLPKKCKHEKTRTIFSFQSENSTALNYFKPCCKECDHQFGYTLFRGTSEDLPYLEVVEQNIGEQDIKAGEYYTMKAIVTFGDYDFDKTRVRCKIESDDITVFFSVEFREEFEERVSLIQEGDEITFCGRLYDDGFGWADSELIEI